MALACNGYGSAHPRGGRAWFSCSACRWAPRPVAPATKAEVLSQLDREIAALQRALDVEQARLGFDIHG